jgi:general secretion pathway protein L
MPIEDWLLQWRDVSGDSSTGCWRDLDASDSKRLQTCELIIPSQWVLASNIAIPLSHRRRLAQSALYQIEPWISVDIQSVHVAHQAKGDMVCFYTIERTLLERLIAACRDHGFDPRLVTTDCQVLAAASEHDSPTLWVSEEQCWVIDPTDTHWAVEQTLASNWMAQWLKVRSSEVPLPQLNVRSTSLSATVTLQRCLPEGLTVSMEEISANELDTVLLQAPIDGCYSLLQGDFEPNTPEVQWRRLRSVRWTAAACLLGVTLLNSILSHQLANQTAEVSAEQATLYRSLFPGERRIVNVRRQFEAHLNAPAGETTQPIAFLEAFSRVANVLPPSDKPEGILEAVSFNAEQRRLMTTVALPNVEAHEQLTQQLKAQGMDAKLTNANSTNGKTIGEYTVHFP